MSIEFGADLPTERLDDEIRVGDFVEGESVESGGGRRSGRVTAFEGARLRIEYDAETRERRSAARGRPISCGVVARATARKVPPRPM